MTKKKATSEAPREVVTEFFDHPLHLTWDEYVAVRDAMDADPAAAEAMVGKFVAREAAE